MVRMPVELVLFVLVAASVSGCATQATPSPPADPRPASAFRLGEVLIRDDFDDPAAGWLSRRSSDPDVEQGYLGGEYFLRLSASYKGNIRATGIATFFSNTHVTVDARLVAGTEARGVGVGCRIAPPNGDGGYILSVFPATGQFALGRQDPDQFVYLVRVEPSEAVRRGNAWNRLELTCAGSTIIARVNGTEVASVQDSTYDKGHVMLMVGRSGSISVEARFDNLVVREALLEGQSAPGPKVTVRVRLSQGGPAFGLTGSAQSLRCGLAGSSPPQAYHLLVQPRFGPLPEDPGDQTGAVSSTQALDSSTVGKDYLSAVEREVAARAYYPSSAVRDGQAGTVVILFSWLKDGHLRMARFEQSSGVPELDQNAVEAVRCAAPFAPIPDQLGHNSMTTTATFGYMLQ